MEEKCINVADYFLQVLLFTECVCLHDEIIIQNKTNDIYFINVTCHSAQLNVFKPFWKREVSDRAIKLFFAMIYNGSVFSRDHIPCCFMLFVSDVVIYSML